MTAFLALYVGDTVNNSDVIAMTADRRIVDDFAKLMLAPKKDPTGRSEKRPSEVVAGGRK